MNFIVDSNLPFNIAQKPSLKTLLENVAGRKIVIPTTRKFMDSLTSQFEATKSKLKTVLDKQKYVCATCDVWSSRANSYLGITVHFISKTYVRKSYILSFRELNGKQTYDMLGKEMANVFVEYGLAIEKITNVVTDGGSAFCKSFRIFARRNNSTILEDDDFIDDNDNDNGEEEDPASLMPYMTHDGEHFVSNIIQLDSIEEVSDTLASGDFDSTEIFDDHVSNEDVIFDSFERNDEILNTIELPPQRRCF